MARRKRESSTRIVAGLPVIRRQDHMLEPVYEADPEGRPVVHHRTVDTLGIMLRAGTITKDMHDAARDFQAQFTIARFDVVRCMPLVRLPGGGGWRSHRCASRRPTACRLGARCARRPRQSGRLLRLARCRAAALDPRMGDAAGLGRQARAHRAGARDPGGGAGGTGGVVWVPQKLITWTRYLPLTSIQASLCCCPLSCSKGPRRSE